jgi:hypothetical protein
LRRRRCRRDRRPDAARSAPGAWACCTATENGWPSRNSSQTAFSVPESTPSIRSIRSPVRARSRRVPTIGSPARPWPRPTGRHPGRFPQVAPVRTRAASSILFAATTGMPAASSSRYHRAGDRASPCSRRRPVGPTADGRGPRAALSDRPDRRRRAEHASRRGRSRRDRSPCGGSRAARRGVPRDPRSPRVGPSRRRSGRGARTRPGRPRRGRRRSAAAGAGSTPGGSPAGPPARRPGRRRSRCSAPSYPGRWRGR